MKNDLTQAQLDQEMTVVLPLSAVLRLADSTPVAISGADKLAQLGRGRPTIGSQGIHGIYAGIARADEHGGDHILEVLDQAPKAMTWQQAMDWAVSIGGTLPTRKQQALLFANVPELFEKEYYWSCEQHADVDAYVWSQSFSYGFQTYTHEDDELRARAVRRLALE